MIVSVRRDLLAWWLLPIAANECSACGVEALMKRWIIPIAVAVSILILGQMFLAMPDLFAQGPGGPFDQFAPGHQEPAPVLFMFS